MTPVRRDTNQAAAAAAATKAAGDHVSALVASYLGWTLDAFDYFLVVFCLTAIGKEFGQTDSAMTLAITITLAFRPVGAFVFGLLADRYGRRMPLMLNLVFYSVVEVLSGLAPNYATFMMLRALFGIGMGGQWGVGASLAMEKVAPRWRGLLSGFLQQGYATGNILAAACFFFLFDKLGWRPLFFIGGLPALLAIFVQFRVKESEVWVKTRHETWGHLFRGILSHWKLFLFLLLLMSSFNFVSHGTQDLYPTFLERQWHFEAKQRAVITAISMVGAIIGGTLFGLFSDRFGRRRAMVTALLAAVLMIPMWAFSPSIALLIAGAFLMQFMVQGAWGVIPAHLSELSPDSVRGFLPGFGYQCGALVGGTLPYIQAVLAKHASYAVAMSATSCTVFLLCAIVSSFSRERRAAQFGSSA
jgi:SHS family lactate transporter-like MFS transporter